LWNLYWIAQRLGQPVYKLSGMPVSELSHWIAFFELMDEQERKHGTRGR